MTYLFNFMIAVFAWLGMFRTDLFPALLTLPFGEVIANLTFVDYLLLTATFIVVTVAMEIFDRYTTLKKPQKVADLRRVKKR